MESIGFWIEDHVGRFILIVYLIGYVLAYFMKRKEEGVPDSWEEVANRAGLSIFSWIAVIIYLLGMLYSYLSRLIGNRPPRWL